MCVKFFLTVLSVLKTTALLLQLCFQPTKKADWKIKTSACNKKEVFKQLNAYLKKKQKKLTIEELNDVGEVHVVFDDDFPVLLKEGQREEGNELVRSDVVGSPDAFPHGKYIVVV